MWNEFIIDQTYVFKCATKMILKIPCNFINSLRIYSTMWCFRKCRVYILFSSSNSKIQLDIILKGSLFFLIWSKNPTAARKRGRKKCTRCINRLSITAINSLSLFPSKELINNYHHHFFLHSTYIQICRRKKLSCVVQKKNRQNSSNLNLSLTFHNKECWKSFFLFNVLFCTSNKTLSWNYFKIVTQFRRI